MLALGSMQLTYPVRLQRSEHAGASKGQKAPSSAGSRAGEPSTPNAPVGRRDSKNRQEMGCCCERNGCCLLACRAGK